MDLIEERAMAQTSSGAAMAGNLGGKKELNPGIRATFQDKQMAPPPDQQGALRLKSNPASPPILSISLPSKTGRVLSIQSHTVQGYVGNKSAVFPLQLLGYDVDPINSVQFSNHTGYSTFRGQVLDGQQLWDLIEGLSANNLLYYTHLLTGYIGSVSFLNAILGVVEKLRLINPELIYDTK
ncbi:Pyridoxal kinase [Platanthera zijinensis]|uniref:pyridoxal kinase n=1 Tax=Platanthera zijinensis TaxID=2320716 RepID=A0AAP0FTF4_9ASPA